MDKYNLDIVQNEEAPLFYSAEPERAEETGCIGHFRMDFGRNGKEFWNSWTDHCPELNTQVFKEDFKTVIDTLRENILTNLSAMSSYCYNNPQAKLTNGRDGSYGFKTKTDSHVYYLRCSTLQGDYNLYCYAYERDKLEKVYPPPHNDIDGELKGKIENAARYIIETSAKETTSGNYITYTGDIPNDIISPELFSKHIQDIADMMKEYEAVAEAEVTEDGAIDTIMYLDYCPNFEPDVDERDKYPDDRITLDPLNTRKWNIEEFREAVKTQILPDGLSEGDRLYYMEKGEYYIDVTIDYDCDDNLDVFYHFGRIDEIGVYSEKSVDYMRFNIFAEDIEQEMKNLIVEYTDSNNRSKILEATRQEICAEIDNAVKSTKSLTEALAFLHTKFQKDVANYFDDGGDKFLDVNYGSVCATIVLDNQKQELRLTKDVDYYIKDESGHDLYSTPENVEWIEYAVKGNELNRKSADKKIKPSLLDRVEKGKEKAARQEKSDKPKNVKKEVLE